VRVVGFQNWGVGNPAHREENTILQEHPYWTRC
jgi:hypothetical protein